MSYGKVLPRKSVCVIGGGVAGLSAAVFLTKENFKVTLIESKPHLGGRAYSFFDKTLNTYVDNGQHILASWYKNTFEFLKIIGSYEKLMIQDSLEVTFRNLNAEQFKLKFPKLTSPFNLLWGIMRFKALSFKDKISLIRFIRTIKTNKFSDKELKEIETDELFRKTNQPENLIKCFWEPFIVAVFNSKPESVSAWLLVKMIKLGFIEKGNSKLVLPKTNLNELYVVSALKYLEANGAKVLTDTKIKEITFVKDMIESLSLDDNSKMKFDYYISAVPFYEIKNLVGEKVYNECFIQADLLKSSPIVNVHLTFTEHIDEAIKNNFYGILNATIQWIFKVRNNQICIVVSDAKKLTNKGKEEILKITISELYSTFPDLQNKSIQHSQVVKEMRATFIPDKNSLSSRPGYKTSFRNFLLAGDWVNTELPATIESATQSAKLCANEIINFN